MLQFDFDPPLPPKPIAGPFIQKLIMRDDSRPLGHASWHSTEIAAGVAQLLELRIEPALRRSGHGRRLLLSTIEQMRAFHSSQKQQLRRVWIGVGHKGQVIGRSFLTKEGFHHIGSAGGILDDQDLLIYVKSFD